MSSDSGATVTKQIIPKYLEVQILTNIFEVTPHEPNHRQPRQPAFK